MQDNYYDFRNTETLEFERIWEQARRDALAELAKKQAEALCTNQNLWQKIKHNFKSHNLQGQS